VEKEELQNMLRQVHAEIETLDPADTNTRIKLSALQSDIQAALEREDYTETESLQKQLEEAMTHLEADYPGLTATLATIINTLSNMGI
jgi:hypothetical protein